MVSGTQEMCNVLMNRPISRISLHIPALPSAAATETCLSNGRLMPIMEPGQLTSAGYWAEKNGKEAPIWGVAQFGEMSHPGS